MIRFISSRTSVIIARFGKLDRIFIGIWVRNAACISAEIERAIGSQTQAAAQAEPDILPGDNSKAAQRDNETSHRR